jgi:hypothetical protein
MAATVTREFMFQKMRDNKLPYFIVTDGRDEISRNEDEASVEAAAAMLEDVLSNVMDSLVIVKLMEKTKKELGRGGNIRATVLEYKIQLRPTAAMRGIGGYGNNMVDDLMRENSKLKDQLTDEKIERIKFENKKELEELRKEMNEKPNPMMEMGMKALGHLFGEPPVTQVAGAEDGHVKQADADRIKNIRAAIVRLSKVDPTLDDTLTALANFAEKNPDKYRSFIPLMKTF